MFEKIGMYEAIKSKGCHNFQGARIPLNHQLNVQAWDKYKSVLSDPRITEYIKFDVPTGA